MRRTKYLAILGAMAVGVAYLGVLPGCTLKDAEAPPLVGPSELGLSLQMEAIPDTLTQDGISQSRIIITARDANSRPVAGLELKIETCVSDPSGTICSDYGYLSQRSVVTGSSGRAELTYTAPPASAAAVGFVTILATPVGSNAANALPRSITIRLLPAGAVNALPIPAFTFLPTSPSEGATVAFDASTSRDPDGAIVSYDWTFGDGTTGTGVRVSKTYREGGTFNVTLTVTDDRGAAASTTRSVSVTRVAGPTAKFVFSPTAPAVGQQVFFNASESTAAAGRRIVDYSWTFGDGTTDSGVTVTKTYAVAADYVVTLTVTDDLGKQGAVSQTVKVGVAGDVLKADFSFSPTEPTSGQLVSFNASASSPLASITSFQWDFGDGTVVTRSTPLAEHTYFTSADKTFTVRLTVRDSAGRTATTAKNLPVKAGVAPTASFTVSPNPAPVRGTVTVDASSSTAGAGSIIRYEWLFGDGSPLTSTTTATTTHVYTAAGTYTIRLTVVNSFGQTASTTRTVVVQ